MILIYTHKKVSAQYSKIQGQSQTLLISTWYEIRDTQFRMVFFQPENAQEMIML